MISRYHTPAIRCSRSGTLVAIFACIGIYGLLGCTDNPLTDDTLVTGDALQIRGKVEYEDRIPAYNAVIWLESFGLLARCDSLGAFELTLPPPIAQGGRSGTSGIFDLSIFVANYHLRQLPLGVRGGQFLYGNGMLDDMGQFLETLRIESLLEIGTAVSPATVSTNQAVVLDIAVSLRADSSQPVLVSFPASFGRPYGAVLLREKQTGMVYVFGSNFDDGFSESRLIGHASAEKEMQISIVRGALPSGTYELIPHLVLTHSFLPNGMLESLADGVLEAGPAYFKLPFRGNAATLVVSP